MGADHVYGITVPRRIVHEVVQPLPITSRHE